MKMVHRFREPQHRDGKNIYSKEETEQYMLRVVEEYEKSYINN